MPRAEDSVLGIVVDSRSDVRKLLLLLFKLSVHFILLGFLNFLIERNVYRYIKYVMSLRREFLDFNFEIGFSIWDYLLFRDLSYV